MNAVAGGSMLNSSGTIIDISAQNGPCADGGSKSSHVLANKIISLIGSAAAQQAEFNFLGHKTSAAIVGAHLKALSAHLQTMGEPSLSVFANSAGKKSTTTCRTCKNQFFASANLENDISTKSGWVYPVRCRKCNKERHRQAAAAEAARSGEASLPGTPGLNIIREASPFKNPARCAQGGGGEDIIRGGTTGYIRSRGGGGGGGGHGGGGATHAPDCEAYSRGQDRTEEEPEVPGHAHA